MHPVLKISRPSHRACAASQSACAGGPHPSQIICVEKGPESRAGPRIIARGYRYRSGQEIAEAEKIDRSFVSRLLRLTLLAPDIQEAILEGGSRRACSWRS